MRDKETRPTDASVQASLETVEDRRRRVDYRVLPDLVQGATGEPPRPRVGLRGRDEAPRR